MWYLTVATRALVAAQSPFYNHLTKPTIWNKINGGLYDGICIHIANIQLEDLKISPSRKAFFQVRVLLLK
jgi:hypothetical protein